jgi:vitamin B12 transport system substrate-binding protein
MAVWRMKKYWVLFLFIYGFALPALAASPPPHRIVTLAPHLTEWVFSLNQQQSLVAVSAYSDYPVQASSLPVVADYQGADIKAILQLSPTIVLAWEGGNRAQDISRLEQLGLHVFRSSVKHPEDIAAEMFALATLLDADIEAKSRIAAFSEDLKGLRQSYASSTTPIPVFYYASTAPLMTVGQQTWANTLLSLCGARTVFFDSPIAYPQVSIKSVLERQPALLLAASLVDAPTLEAFWQPHRAYLDAQLIVVNPDVMSRYTLRLLPTLTALCADIHSSDRRVREEALFHNK